MAMPGLFITGTDTNVGKTYVACLIIRMLRDAGVRVGAYKPVCSGARRRPDGALVWDDVWQLSNAVGHRIPADRICPQRFQAPLAPPVAARLEDRSVDESLLRDGFDWFRETTDFVVVEGAGGLLSPLGDSCSSADLAADLGLPLIVVAADRLGMLNHTLLTVDAAAARGLHVAGVIVNRTTPDPDGSAATNFAELQRRCSAPVLGLVEFGGVDLLRPTGEAARIDFQQLARPAHDE